jgi:hypothetical protein
MTTIVNVFSAFAYYIPTSSINYVRNYNFNPSTVTQLPVILENKSNDYPITVDITTSHPWVNILNPTTGQSAKIPSGNVVIPTSSRLTVNMSVDLPPEIEAITVASTAVSMSFYIRSGSFPLIYAVPGSTGYELQSNTDIIILTPANSFQEVNITPYFAGVPLTGEEGELVFLPPDPTVAGLTGFTPNIADNTVTVFGVSSGETVLRVYLSSSIDSSDPVRKEIPIRVIGATEDYSPPGNRIGSGPQEPFRGQGPPPAGPAGPAGPAAPAGPAGPSGGDDERSRVF